MTERTGGPGSRRAPCDTTYASQGSLLGSLLTVAREAQAGRFIVGMIINGTSNSAAKRLTRRKRSRGIPSPT